MIPARIRKILQGYRETPAPGPGEDTALDSLAWAVCQLGGHVPNRDRTLPAACDFHRRMSWAYLRIIDAARAEALRG